MQHKGIKFYPSTISTYDAEEAIKAAAKENNSEFYFRIKDLDLIAKEFKYHKHCYGNFTRGFGKAARNADVDQVPSCSKKV